jgi:ribosomal protein L25 (general stress protein Ctc)
VIKLFLSRIGISGSESLPLRALFEKGINQHWETMEIIAIKGQPKEQSGKQAAKQIRNSGMVPAVMYKSGGGEAVQFSANPAEFRHLVYSAKFKLAEVDLNGQKHRCILKDIQFHPVRRRKFGISIFWSWCRAWRLKPSCRSAFPARRRA